MRQVLVDPYKPTTPYIFHLVTPLGSSFSFRNSGRPNLHKISMWLSLIKNNRGQIAELDACNYNSATLDCGTEVDSACVFSNPVLTYI